MKSGKPGFGNCDGHHDKCGMPVDSSGDSIDAEIFRDMWKE